MRTITWDEAVSILNKWAVNKRNVHFAKVGHVHPERRAFEAIHGDTLRILSVSVDEGTIELEVRGKPVPVDLRGATIQYGDKRVNSFEEDLTDVPSPTLEFTFPEGEKWILDEAPIEI